MIKWSDIKTEYEGLETGFRASVIALFREHEGQETDEKTKQGRVIKVTITSFAQHMGIPKQTFHDWVKNSVSTDTVLTEEACMNDGIPPAVGFVIPLIETLRSKIPYLSLLSPETHTLIAEDLAILENAIAEVRSHLKVSSA